MRKTYQAIGSLGVVTALFVSMINSLAGTLSSETTVLSLEGISILTFVAFVFAAVSPRESQRRVHQEECV